MGIHVYHSTNTYEENVTKKKKKKKIKSPLCYKGKKQAEAYIDAIPLC